MAQRAVAEPPTPGDRPSPADDLRTDRPAVANLLVHNGTPTSDAVAATVADLAARGFLHIEEVAGTHCYRLTRGANRQELVDYERRVLRLFRHGGRGKLVPFDQLTVGAEDEADAWWRAFAAGVTGDARALGYLSRRIEVLAIAGIAALGGVVLAALAYASSRPRDSTAQLVAVLLFATIGCAGTVATGLDGWVRLSRRGRWRAREWMRVSHELGDADGFRGVRIGGVVVWGDTLADAVALGLAPQAVADVPIRSDGPRSTWVCRNGAWEHVDIRYPRRVPPGCGRPPWLVALVGLASLGVAVALLLAAAQPGTWYPNPPFSDPVAGALGDLEPVVVVIALLLGSVGTWAGTLALLDLVSDRLPVHGVVVARRVDVTNLGPWTDFAPRSRSLALDDGQGRALRAYRVRRRLFEAVCHGDEVDGTATRNLRYVAHLDVVPCPPDTGG